MYESASLPAKKPPEKKESQKKYRIGIVENSEQLETAAHDVGDAKMTASKEELRGVGGFFKKIWKHNLFNEVYRQKEITKARAAIKESGNVYIGEGGDAKHHALANQAIVERFVSEYDETVHKEAGEKRETLGNKEEERAIQTKIRKLVLDYATSKETPNDEAFEAEKTRIFNELKGVKKDIIDKGDLYADNVLEIAKQIRQNIDHNKGCADLDIDFEIVIGKAKAGARTEAQFNAVDRITEKIHKSPVGRFVNEATVTSAVAIAYNLGIAASQRIASSKLAAWGTFGATAILGGGIAAARESRKLEVERKQHFREMAQGKSFDPSKAERREEMEKSRYETRDATSLIQGLEQSLYTIDKNGVQKLKVLDQAGAENVLKQLAEIESRIKLSDTQKIDLISYSDVKNIEGERLALDLARAKAKVDIRKITKGNSADTYLAKLQGERIKELTKGDRGIEEKNALFQAMKKKKVAMAAFKGVATGLIVGAAAQEIVSFLNDQQHGLIEGLVNPSSKTAGANPQHLTSLEFVRRYFSGDLPPGGGGSGAVVSPQEYLAAHHDGMEKIRRVLWYDNDTPKPIFDKNELKLWWGGTRGTGIDANGNYVFNMKHMLPDGSYHKNFSADAQDLMQSGKLKMLFSLSKDTQNQVFEIPIDAKGNAVIDPNSEIGKMLFANKGGHAEFLGKYAEVAQAMGSKDGAEQVRILATHVGKGVSEVELPSAPYIVDQPIIPVFGRKPLEPTLKDKIRPESFGGYFVDKKKNIARWRSTRSPRLLENPSAELSQQEEIDWYFEEQTRAKGREYIQELESFVGRDKNLATLSKDTKTIVCIPVASAHEMDNIYKTLELYREQDKESLEKTNILLNINWPDDANIKDVEKTISEVERAKKDFPEVKISYFTKQWPREWIDSKEGQIYGTVVKYLNDMALMAIKKANIEHDIYLLTNDADCQGMSKTYLKNMQENAQKNNKADAFLGKIEWGSEIYDKYPGFHVSMRFIQYLDTIFRYSAGERKNVASSGANFLCKASTFAAVGGYDDGIGAGADTNLGSRIKAARSKDSFTFKESDYPIKYINSAWLDTDPSRGLRYYKDGLPIIEMWNDFDEGGYEPRGDISLADEDTEDLSKDPKTVMKRIEFQLTEVVNRWVGFEKKELYTKALDLLLPKDNGKRSWVVEGSGMNSKIKFTPEGYVWLKKHLDDFATLGKKDILYKTRGIRAGKEAPAPETEIQKTVAKYLSYAGVDHASVKENTKRIEGGEIKINERKYAAALLDAFKERPQGEVTRLAGKMRVDFDTLIGKFGFIKNQNPFSRNDTWIYWDIAKQYYLNGHPKESGAGYTVSNPLENQSKQEEIVNRHFGWELHANRKNLLADAEFVAKFLSSTQGKKLKKLLDKPPKANGTLSSKDLALLGKYVREQMA